MLISYVPKWMGKPFFACFMREKADLTRMLYEWRMWTAPLAFRKLFAYAL